MKFTVDDQRITAPLNHCDDEGAYDLDRARAICASQVVTLTANGRAAFHYFLFDRRPCVFFDMPCRSFSDSDMKEISERIDASQRWLSKEMSRIAALDSDLATIKRWKNPTPNTDEKN